MRLITVPVASELKRPPRLWEQKTGKCRGNPLTNTRSSRREVRIRVPFFLWFILVREDLEYEAHRLFGEARDIKSTGSRRLVNPEREFSKRA